MAEYLIQDTTLVKIANAIRNKTGKTGSLSPDAMASSLNAIPTKAAATITPGTSDKTIAAGTYLTGKQTIAGDANLVADNIKKGVNIFGVAGNYDGVELNFQVVGGTTEPVNRTENMIWVNTDTPITGYYFRAEQPGNMANGEVWFSTGTASPGAFNALKKNCIKVYPIKAMQMVGGVLVKKTAKSWNDNGWAEWYTYLLQNGVDATDITGGWKGINATAANTGYVITPYVEFVNGLLHFYTDNEYAGRYGMGVTKKMINLTNATTLYFKVESATNYFPAQVGAWTINGNTAVLAAGKTDITGGCEVAVDVSTLSGSYYIGALIGLKDFPGTKAIARIYLSNIYWE